MEIIKLEGIVIGETNYSESSKILNVLTKEKGVIGIMSKGCRNVKSKLRSVSTRLVYGYFNIYYKDKGLSTLISVDSINPLRKIQTDIDRISYVSYITDLVSQVSKQTEENLFDIYINSILKINELLNPNIIKNIVEIKLLDVLGIMPNIDCCSICGNPNDIVTINVDEGGFICKSCYQGQKIYDEKTIKLIKLFYYVDINKITKLEVSDKIQKELEEFIDMYYEQYTGLYLKSKTFLKSLKKLSIN